MKRDKHGKNVTLRKKKSKILSYSTLKNSKYTSFVFIEIICYYYFKQWNWWSNTQRKKSTNRSYEKLEECKKCICFSISDNLNLLIMNSRFLSWKTPLIFLKVLNSNFQGSFLFSNFQFPCFRNKISFFDRNFVAKTFSLKLLFLSAF